MLEILAKKVFFFFFEALSVFEPEILENCSPLFII